MQKDHKERAQYQDARKKFNRVTGIMELIRSSFLTVASVSGSLNGFIGAAFVASKQLRMTFGFIFRRIPGRAGSNLEMKNLWLKWILDRRGSGIA